MSRRAVPEDLSELRDLLQAYGLEAGHQTLVLDVVDQLRDGRKLEGEEVVRVLASLLQTFGVDGLGKKKPKKKQRRPTGPYVTYDEKWRERVRVELRRRGWDQQALADAVGCSEGSITNLLKPGPPRQSRLVRRVERVFGWAPQA